MVRVILSKLVVVSLCLAPIVTTGCGRRGGLETAEARGRVTLNGEPVTSGRVMFFPVGKVGKSAGKNAQGMLNSRGEFVLGTYDDDDGAVIGEHRVSVLSFPDPMSGEDVKTLGTPVPDRVTVKAGETNEFHIELKPHPPRPRGRNNDDDEDDFRL